MPLLTHEDQDLYRALLLQLAKEIRPDDIVEWLWIKDVADLSWEVIRWRIMRVALINRHSKSSQVLLLHDQMNEIMYGDNVPEELSYTEEEIQKITDSISLNLDYFDADLVAAKSFSRQAASIETLEKLLAAAEMRRNNALREIDDRRLRFWRALRQASDKIIDSTAPLVPLVKVPEQ